MLHSLVMSGTPSSIVRGRLPTFGLDARGAFSIEWVGAVVVVAILVGALLTQAGTASARLAGKTSEIVCAIVAGTCPEVAEADADAPTPAEVPTGVEPRPGLTFLPASANRGPRTSPDAGRIGRDDACVFLEGDAQLCLGEDDQLRYCPDGTASCTTAIPASVVVCAPEPRQRQETLGGSGATSFICDFRSKDGSLKANLRCTDSTPEAPGAPKVYESCVNTSGDAGAKPFVPAPGLDCHQGWRVIKELKGDLREITNSLVCIRANGAAVVCWQTYQTDGGFIGSDSGNGYRCDNRTIPAKAFTREGADSANCVADPTAANLSNCTLYDGTTLSCARFDHDDEDAYQHCAKPPACPTGDVQLTLPNPASTGRRLQDGGSDDASTAGPPPAGTSPAGIIASSHALLKALATQLAGLLLANLGPDGVPRCAATLSAQLAGAGIVAAVGNGHVNGVVAQLPGDNDVFVEWPPGTELHFHDLEAAQDALAAALDVPVAEVNLIVDADHPLAPLQIDADGAWTIGEAHANDADAYRLAKILQQIKANPELASLVGQLSVQFPEIPADRLLEIAEYVLANFAAASEELKLDVAMRIAQDPAAGAQIVSNLGTLMWLFPRASIEPMLRLILGHSKLLPRLQAIVDEPGSTPEGAVALLIVELELDTTLGNGDAIDLLTTLGGKGSETSATLIASALQALGVPRHLWRNLLPAIRDVIRSGKAKGMPRLELYTKYIRPFAGGHRGTLDTPRVAAFDQTDRDIRARLTRTDGRG